MNKTESAFSSLPLSFVVIFSVFIFLTSCQRKADYATVENPMKDFVSNVNDSLRGAKSIEDLSCDLFLTLQGEITFNQLSHFIPDSEDIAHMYLLTQNSLPQGKVLKVNADSAHQSLQQGFYAAQSKAAVLHSDWKNAELKRVLVIDIEYQRLPSKKIIIEAIDGKTTLRASAKCLKIGDRWFIGEDIRYGV